MGEITELVLDGILCQYCGSFVDEIIVGHPRTCEDCTKNDTDVEGDYHE